MTATRSLPSRAWNGGRPWTDWASCKGSIAATSWPAPASASARWRSAPSSAAIGPGRLGVGARRRRRRGLPGLPHFPPKAKRVIYLFQSGAPSQVDLFDDKPALEARRGIDLPDSVRMGQRLTGMTSGQKSFPVAPSIFKFARHGQSGASLSELLPHTAKVADDLCIVRSMQTEAINHDPAITFFQTGSQLAGRPSMGAWVAYGLGSVNQDLPAFVVLLSRGRTDQPLYDRLWGSGFLPTRYQGVKLRGGKEPVLYLNNPTGLAEADPPADARRHRRAQRPAPRGVRRPGDPHPDRAVRAGLPHAVLGARS